jgi:peptidoglycan/xylan/chitin deacetylase (PgdA/CDA1 family)
MHQIRTYTVAAVAAVICITGALPVAAHAQSCLANPNALGTTRILVVAPTDYMRLGTMRYHETLPLADKEVVLTFDDGPLPPYSNKILDILTAECVKATFFIVGRMAREFPDMVRREYAAGYTIGAHSQNHPLRFQKLSGHYLHHEIDDGIASVRAALGDPNHLAPFFRVPGLNRTDEIDHELAVRSLVTFSADVVADDWHRRITPDQIIKRAMSRLEKRGKGSILLLHDIHPTTVAALPGLLKELKDHGYHIVQVVPPAPAEPEIVGGPKVLPSWFGLPDQIIYNGALAAAWPQTNVNVAPDNASGSQLPVPSVQDFGISLQGQLLLGAGLGLQSNLDVPSDHSGLRHGPLRSRHRSAATNGRRQYAALPRLTELRARPTLSRLGIAMAIRHAPARTRPSMISGAVPDSPANLRVDTGHCPSKAQC